MTHNKLEVYAKALPCVKFSLDTAARVCVLVFFFFFEKSVSYDYAFSGSRVLFTGTINLFFQQNFH